jgi:hypothetical protein
MEFDMQEIENIRVQFESCIMGIEGVVGIGAGLCNGKPCLKIYTSVPTQQVRSKLPEELSKIEVDLEYAGEIEAK